MPVGYWPKRKKKKKSKKPKYLKKGLEVRRHRRGWGGGIRAVTPLLPAVQRGGAAGCAGFKVRSFPTPSARSDSAPASRDGGIAQCQLQTELVIFFFLRSIITSFVKPLTRTRSRVFFRGEGGGLFFAFLSTQPQAQKQKKAETVGD